MEYGILCLVKSDQLNGSASNAWSMGASVQGSCHRAFVSTGLKWLHASRDLRSFQVFYMFDLQT